MFKKKVGVPVDLQHDIFPHTILPLPVADCPASSYFRTIPQSYPPSPSSSPIQNAPSSSHTPPASSLNSPVHTSSSTHSSSSSHNSHSNTGISSPTVDLADLPSLDPVRPKRNAKAPSYLSQYHCYLTQNTIPTPIPSTRYPLSSVLSYDLLAPEFQQFILAITLETEPHTFKQAMASEYWKNACNSELTALEGHKTWSVVSLPPGHNVVGCKWVFTIKYNADGTVERYKARLVAKGYTQEEGVDYFDTFSPVAKLTTVKLLLGVAAIKNWTLTQMDVSNAFLHGELDEEIYMSLPQGYTPPDGQPLPPNAVCKLHKSLYGLKQASRQWYHRLSTVIMNAGFKQCAGDHTLFTRKTGSVFLAVLVYVDDIVIASNNLEAEKEFKDLLHREFMIKDLGPMKFFLGLEVARNKNGISVCQRKYALDLIEGAGFLGCKPCAVPMDPVVQLSKEDGELLANPTVYRELVGKLLYLTITRPDITFVVHKLSQFISCPTGVHLTAAQRVVRYLKSNPGQGLFFPSDSDLGLSAFADAD
ncbi:Reverse transcriptase RNA-dependent DNA polymerase [Arabidopsis thaliana x Arabidopsis arenosa]|uniref:Reverse transcriptase RNA-dependent DNA polymerase n=1 Tax=Arabidopsis thaliana x Arabidopsis arenosa TaxID=1240361 RepID=A0A8T2BI47_9BRAS|nr:Reverse transcriptase RNA-dependent DNA polymerase [Arabidopsis thaliana x Arabidopsis arenosa]